MKTKYLSSFIILAMMVCISASAQKRSSFTIYFTTLGNCGICQNRIQNAVKALPGIDTVYWNIPKKQTTVTYDQALCDPYTIMHAIANVGHDNEWFRAPDSSYNKLVGSCCEYTRTINYDTVQVGYLYMMGIWIYPQGLESMKDQKITVYPSIGDGIFHVSIPPASAPASYVLSVLSMTGEKILSASVLTGTRSSFDIRSFPDGQYLLVVSNGSQILSSTKLVKIK
jgi:periplasmic mercuric ion binding protein